MLAQCRLGPEAQVVHIPQLQLVVLGEILVKYAVLIDFSLRLEMSLLNLVGFKVILSVLDDRHVLLYLLDHVQIVEEALVYFDTVWGLSEVVIIVTVNINGFILRLIIDLLLIY